MPSMIALRQIARQLRSYMISSPKRLNLNINTNQATCDREANLHLGNTRRPFLSSLLHNVEVCRAARLALRHKWGTGPGGLSFHTARELEGPEAQAKDTAQEHDGGASQARC